MTALPDTRDAATSNPVSDRALEPYAAARVLVVDDNQPSVALVQATLRLAGLSSIESVTDAARAVEKIRNDRPDLVLLDLHMPGVDGYSILAALRNMSSTASVLVLTADTTRNALQRAFELGARDFLTKPVDPTELALRVRNLLHIHALHGLLERRERWTQASADLARALNARDHPRPNQLVADLTRTAADADLAIYRPASDDGGTLDVFVARTRGSDPNLVDASSLLWALQALDDGRPRLLGELPTGLAASDYGANGMVIPVATARSRIGILGLQRTADARPFTQQDLDLAAEFGLHLATDVALAEADQRRRGYEVAEERHRIARDLHDQVIQRLFAIGIHIEAIGRQSEPDDIENEIAARVRELNQTIELIRTTVFNPATASTTLPAQTGPAAHG